MDRVLILRFAFPVRSFEVTRILALTGGIASGKSTAMDMFAAACPGLVSFKADDSVRRLLAADAEVIGGVRGIFGEAALGANGAVDRAYLRARIFEDSALRVSLESLLHPRVREECLELRDRACKVAAPLFLAEVPLLFEGGFHFGQDLNLLVAVSPDTQVNRLRARNGFDAGMAGRILEAQWPMNDKLSRADVVFWNEGPESCLSSQIHRFLQCTQ